MLQSLILAAILSIIGFLLLCVAVLADLLATNRRLLEETLYRVRKLELDAGAPAGASDEIAVHEPAGPDEHALASATPSVHGGERD
jgi:hypothetical protein